MTKITCIKDFLVKNCPNDYIIPKGTDCRFEGYLMGRYLTFSLCPQEFPPDSKYTNRRHVTLFNDKKVIKDHFKIEKE